MRRATLFVLAFLALGMGGIAVAHAAIRPYEKLSVAEQVALQESEQRVSHYDLELHALDRERVHRRISADEYEWDTSELTFCIQQESLFQNAILVRRCDLPQRTADVLRTVGTVAIAVPTYTLLGVLYIVGHSSGLHGSFSP